MTKTVRFLSMLIGVLLFVVGLLVGQQGGRSKFDKYSRSAGVTQMQVAILQANVGVLRKFLPMELPDIYYESSCACFIAHAFITEELMKKPLGDVQARFMVLATMARMALEVEFPELSKSGVVPDRDFKMTFDEVSTEKPGRIVTVAEYSDGKIVFKGR